MTSLVSKGRTGVASPWLEKVRIWSHKAVHVVPAHKLLSLVFFSNGGNWLNVTKLLWSALQQITIIRMLFMIASYLFYNQHYHHKFSTLHKYHPDQHLRDLLTEWWIEEFHPPPMRTTAWFSSTATAQEPNPLALNENVGPLSLPGGRRESWWKYREVGFKSIGNNY